MTISNKHTKSAEENKIEKYLRLTVKVLQFDSLDFKYGIQGRLLGLR